MPFSGQLWYITEGGDADTRIARVNDDSTTTTTVVSNGGVGTGDDQFVSSFTSGLGVDTAAGFYFAVLSNTIDDHALLVRGAIDGSGTPTTVVDFPDNIIVETIEVDTINHKIYAGYQDGSFPPSGAITGIRVYSYDPLTGAVTDNGFLTTAATDSRPNESGFSILDARDFAIDHSIVPGGRMYYTETIGGLATGLFRLDLANPNTVTTLVNDSQFSNTSYADGVFVDVEVDETTDLVYFTTHSQNPSPSASYDANDNALWYISGNAVNGTAVKVTLTGLPVGSHYYGGDMTFDQSTRQIYLESEEVENSGTDTDDVIYVFQLDAAGTSANLIRTISPGLSTVGATVEGMVFTDLAALTVNGSATAATEQSASATTLLSGSPTIVDADGAYLVGATVQITGGTFTSNESSTADDHLGYGAGKQITGTIAGTSITVSWNAATETLTLSGYDTFAHYQAALAGLVYWATGDNPTNYGANTTRTLTWTINDGTPGVVAGSVNSGTTTLNIAAVNDAPVNSASVTASGNEDTDIAVTGLQISDVDADPASATMTVVLSVTHGVLTLRTDVAGGLTAGDIAANGAGTVTVTGTINAINATLAAANGLVFHGDPDVSGTDTLTVVTSDGGATGSGGAQSDTDSYTITINGTQDPHTGGVSITGSSTEDQVLTAVSTLADADGLGTLHYQWQRDSGSGFVNVGLDQSTYTLGDADVGAVVRVIASYTDGLGAIESATSAATGAVAAVDDAPTGGVSITGTTTEDQVLTANTSTLADVDGLGALHYQWQRDSGSGFVNVGTDQATYTLGDADVGATVRVVASYTDGQGFNDSVTSAATAPIANVNDAPTGGASINGTATQNQVLTANTSTLADADGLGTLHYQWQRDTGSGFVNVGTDQSTYTLGAADVGGVVRVTASYVDGHGTAEAVTSAATAPVASSGPPNLHLVGTPGFDILVGGLGNDVIEGKGFTDILVGGGGSDTFVFGAHSTGVDLIADFGRDDVILTKSKLSDSNNDGIVPTHAGLLDLGGLDAVFLGLGHEGVRYLGVTADGLYAYGDADARPKKAIEGKLSNDNLAGDVGDHKSNVFFFDTDLALDWGSDHIVRFGAKDILVTTTALADPNHDNLILAGPGSVFDFIAPANSAPGTDNGSVTINNTSGAVVSTLEFDGVVSHGDVDYYIYSLVGSSGGVGSIFF